MLQQNLARLLAAADHEVQHPLRKASFLEDLDQPHRHPGRVGCGLQDNGVPSDESGHDLPGRDRHWEVPGRDRSDDPERLPDRHRPLVWQLGRHGLTEHPASFAAHVERHVDALLDITLGLGENLPHLFGHLAAELFLAVHHQLTNSIQDLTAFRRGISPPRVERSVSRLDSCDHVVAPALRKAADHRSSCRVRALDRAAALRIDPPAIDVVPEISHLVCPFLAARRADAPRAYARAT